MKQLLLLFVLSLSSLSQAQTAIIAHKSHSGSASDFFTDPSSNFGIPVKRLVQVIRLNDSTSIQVYDDRTGYFHYDTVYRHPVYSNYNLNIDSVKKRPYSNTEIEYINFKHSPKSAKPIAPGYNPKKLDQKHLDQTKTDSQQEVTPKKKKKSYLLFLFGITGGGMLLFGAVNRLFTPQMVS